MALLSLPPKLQFFDNNGLPLVGGKLYTYEAGTTTPKDTFLNETGNVYNTNPIILDSRGEALVWLASGKYKFVLATAENVELWSVDNISGGGTGSGGGGTSFVPGMIMLWSGSVVSIPEGWALCNGSNGTPDLRNRFIVGAGSTYNVAATGGSADAITVSHTHTFSATTASDGAHTHTLLSKTEATAGGGQVPRYSGDGSITNNEAIQSAGAHTHTVSGTTASTGSSGTNANLPPYYALAYIMKT